MTLMPDKSPEPTAVGAVRSAIAVHTLWPCVPELWTLGIIALYEKNIPSA